MAARHAASIYIKTVSLLDTVGHMVQDGPVPRQVIAGIRGTRRSPGSRVRALGAAHEPRMRAAVYKRPPDPALPPSGRLYTTAGQEVVKDKSKNFE
ncbi:unnamed protein product, partial [Staurois parvus]